MKKLFSLLLICLFISINVISQQHRSQIVRKSTLIQVSNNSLIYTDSIVMQINERMGDHDAKDKIIYQKGNKVSFGDIWIEDIKGNRIRKLDKNEIKEQNYINGFSLYEDRLVKYFEAKHNTYPYRLVYTKKQEYKNYVNIIDLDYSEYKIPINEGILTLEHPIDRQIKQKIKNIDSYKTDTVNQTVRRKYTYSHKPDLHRQKYSSVNISKAPQITIVPIDFKYGIAGTNENWESLGKWNYILNNGRDQLPSTETIKIDQIVDTLKSKTDSVKALYKYLQENNRYVDISTRIGGLQTHPAEYVVKNRYGDCKALTNYMRTMLKHVGIESFYTIIYAGDEVHDLDNDFSYNAFNHAILSVPIGSDTLFLECTSKNNPAGYVSSSIQGRKALISKENGSKLIDMPHMKPKDVICTRNFDITMRDEGKSDIVLNARERGESYEVANAYEEGASRNTVDNFIRQNILDGSFDITDYKIVKDNRDSAYIDLKIISKVDNIHKKYGKNLVISPFPFYLPNMETPDKRTQYLQIDYPINKRDRIVIHVDNFSISKLPPNTEIQSPWGDYYRIAFTQDKNTIIIEKELLITAKRLDLKQYNDFYSFVTKVKKNETANYYFEIL